MAPPQWVESGLAARTPARLGRLMWASPNAARATRWLAAQVAALLAAGAAAAAPDDLRVPYVETPPAVVDGMLDLAELQPGERLIDLGSGDGRIVLAAARRGASALGVELAPDLVRRAREAARFEGLEARASFRRDDLFVVPLRDADVVTLYLLPGVNLRLRPKLLAELRAGARVVSHAFDMADWAPDAHRSIDGKNVYLWVVPATAGGRWKLTLGDGRVATLVIEQRFQQVAGTLDSVPIGGAALRGDRLRFTAGGQAFHAIVAHRTLAPDPAAPAGAAVGWHAERAE